MKLSLSNLAWDIPDNDQILSILNINNVSNVEGVLSKIDDWDKLTNEVLLEYKKKLDFYNIKMESIQSIFYNVKCDGINDTEIVYKHIDRLIEICKILEVNVMVFGYDIIFWIFFNVGAVRDRNLIVVTYHIFITNKINVFVKIKMI